MVSVLVTGGTGTLGRPTVSVLRRAGHDVRVLSRRSTPGLVTADLLTGTGVREALGGIEVIVHLATCRRDDAATRRLVAGAEEAGVRHLIMVSIVGVDRIPLPYYQRKLASERAISASRVPHSLLRATQFHDLVARLFSAQRMLPVLVAPAFALQPVDVTDVAGRLAQLCAGQPAGRVADFGGPEIFPASLLAREWAAAVGSRRPVRSLRLPGRTFAAYRAGHHLAPDQRAGSRSFTQFLADRVTP